MTNIGDMSSIQIKLAANKLLKNNENVQLGQQDLELLWEFTKQDKSLNLPADLSDEEVIAMMDSIDTENNTAKESYANFKAWLKEFIIPSKKEPTIQKPVNPPNVGVPPVIVEPDKNESIKADENAIILDKNTNVNLNTTLPNKEAFGAEKQFMQLYPKGSQTVEINGKSYTISNDSKTSNNFAYYMDGETLVIEGHYLTITSDLEGDVADNIKVIGNANKIDMKQGNDQVEAEGSMNMLYAGEGEDFIKIRGDMNSVDMGTGEDTVWIAGNNNQAHGGDNVRENAINSDKFYAMGASNNLFGQDGVDAAYYNTTDAVEGEFDAGKGQELRIEEKITDGTDFEKWVNREDEQDGPPYSTLPDALDGHEVRAYDDNTYTDKYEKVPVYYTEYRDIEYREMSALTTQNKETGEGSVTKYNAEDGERKIVLNPDGSVVVTEGEYSASLAANEVVFYDENGEVVSNTGFLESMLEKIATGKLFVGNEDGVIKFEKPEIVAPEEEAIPVGILSQTQKDGVITTTYNPASVGTEITAVEDTNNNTGKLVYDGGVKYIEFAENGDIVFCDHRLVGGPSTRKYEADNVEFYNPQTNETVARPENLSDLMNEIAFGNIAFKSKSALPAEKEGHTIKQVDDKYYTDSYEKDGVTLTDYKDLKHRTLYAQMTVNNETGEASFTKKNYSITAEGDTTYTMDKSGNLKIKNSYYTSSLFSDEYTLQDKDGKIVNNLTTQEKIYKIMIGELTVVENTNIEINRTCLVSTEIDENGCIHKTYETRWHFGGATTTTSSYDPSTGEAVINGSPYIKINADGSVIKSSHNLPDGMTIYGEDIWKSKLNADEVSYVDTKTGEIINDVEDIQVLLDKLVLGEIDIIPKAKDGHTITSNGYMYEDTYQQDGKTIIERKDVKSFGFQRQDVLTVDNKTGECSLCMNSDSAIEFYGMKSVNYNIKPDGTMFNDGEEIGNIKDLKFCKKSYSIPEGVEFKDWGMPQVIARDVDVQNLSYQEILYKMMKGELYIRDEKDGVLMEAVKYTEISM